MSLADCSVLLCSDPSGAAAPEASRAQPFLDLPFLPCGDAWEAIQSEGAIMIRALGMFVVSVMLSLTGCATIVKGNDQNLAITTDPEGASCSVQRKGMYIATVNPTPGSFRVDKSSAALDLKCTKQGYLNTETQIDSSFQGWFLGNLILGGIVGIVVDASSGAMNQYQATIALILTPESFPTAEARDAFFTKRRDEVAENKKLSKEKKEAMFAEIETRMAQTGIAAAVAPTEAASSMPDRTVPNDSIDKSSIGPVSQ